jgi:hypothetical protein
VQNVETNPNIRVDGLVDQTLTLASFMHKSKEPSIPPSILNRDYIMIPEALIPEFDRTLLSGGYNLLLGAGISLDSRNSKGEFLRSSEQLRKDLCTLAGAGPQTSLSRVYPLLTSEQAEHELVERFSGCVPGRSLRYLSRYLWRRAFTFNIDDVVEAHYEMNSGAKQVVVPLNYDAPFEPAPRREDLQVIHLHGWIREPSTGFVFSAAEYARIMRDLNPWMHLLSEILATESFIIAGTSLSEMDLEYYLSHRTTNTPRRGRGPSLLIEPSPDVVTRSDCKRYGLVLVEATFEQFLDWLYSRIPAPPSLRDLVVPDTEGLFRGTIPPRTLLRFFSDFELVPAGDRPLPRTPSPFLYGRAPRWAELDEHLDIERQDNGTLADLVQASVADPVNGFILVVDQPGTGKTTTVRRVAHNFANAGMPTLSVTTLSRIDPEVAITCLSAVTGQVLLVVDGLADHIEQISEIVSDPRVAQRVIVLGSERSYRLAYLDIRLADRPRTDIALRNLTTPELEQLIERYRHFGLVGTTPALMDPKRFAVRLSDEPIAISICRILNDFRPFDLICDSLWNEADDEDKLAYLCMALAYWCYRGGLRYSILQAIMGPSRHLASLFEGDVPLRLAESESDDDFIVPENAVVAERILFRSPRRGGNPSLMSSFQNLSRAIAPHVNRKAIMRRSPEARLARRLFDYDTVVKPLLGALAEEFYISVQKQWEWNSRYWEQRALLLGDTDLGMALQYARHAVAIEKHPFPLTTLGKLLLKQMEVGENRDRAFAEAFDHLGEAIDIEAHRKRTTVHPFATLLSGAARYLELGGELTFEQGDRIDRYADEADRRYASDAVIAAAMRRLYEADDR